MSSMRTSVRTIAACVAIAACSAVAVAGALRTRLEARFSGPGVQAKAAYVQETRNRGTRLKLTVEVQNAQPGAEFPVTADGIGVGTIRINGFGRGKLDLQSGGDDPKQSKVPVLTAGDIVTVGTASGTLAPR